MLKHVDSDEPLCHYRWVRRLDGGHSVLEEEEDEFSGQDSTYDSIYDTQDQHNSADSSALSLNHRSGLDEVHETGPQLYCPGE